MPRDVGRILPDSTPGCVIWTVEDFFSHPQDADEYMIVSPCFSALGVDWRLAVTPSIEIAGASFSILTLKKYPSHPLMPNFVRFHFGIRGKGGAELIAYSGEKKFRGANCVLWETLLPANWRRDREEFAPGGVLSVFCRLRKGGATPGNDTSAQTEDVGQVSQGCVHVLSKSCNSPGNDTSTQTEEFRPLCHNCADGASKSCNSPGALNLAEHLKGLLSTEELCDVTLKVHNQEFKAHRALLAARSSVFRAMFCQEMSEMLSKEVRITDCDPDAFRIFLRHVYTGDAEGLSASNAFDVFSVADKYDATDLKIQCKDCIASNITVESVCEVVAFSLLHSDSVLLEMASEFFIKHFSQIVLTNKWQCFLRDHTTPANELIIRASKFHVPPE